MVLSGGEKVAIRPNTLCPFLVAKGWSLLHERSGRQNITDPVCDIMHNPYLHNTVDFLGMIFSSQIPASLVLQWTQVPPHNANPSVEASVKYGGVSMWASNMTLVWATPSTALGWRVSSSLCTYTGVAASFTCTKGCTLFLASCACCIHGLPSTRTICWRFFDEKFVRLHSCAFPVHFVYMLRKLVALLLEFRWCIVLASL